MDIFDYARQMEKDGESYYRELAGRTGNAGLKSILTMLADEEVKHYDAIERIGAARPNAAATTVLTDAKNVFAQMKESGQGRDVDPEQTELYRKALDIEKKSQDFYETKADEVEETYQKGVFLRLAEEESKHYFLLENIIEFVSRPETWLEDAEFNHLEDY
jgi:rubrerythrin